MTKRLFLPRTSSSALSTALLDVAELAWDRTLKRFRAGDGQRLGGRIVMDQDDGDAIVITVPHTYVEGTDATAFLQAVADRARDLNCPWKLRNGVTYTILGTVTTYTDFDYSGAHVITMNAGQTGPVFSIAPMPADVEAVPLATAETWTLNQGSAFVPELAGQRGWTYTIDCPLADILRTGGGNIRQGQTFTVVSDDGQLSEPIHVAFTRPFAASTIITRQRMRAPVRIRGGAIRIVSSSGTTGRAMMLQTTRSNSAFENCAIINETDLEILQGFVAEKCETVTFDNTDTRGLKVNATNYGYNGSLVTDITLINARESGCRRGFDSHKCCNIRVIGGTFPDGGGAHWYHRMVIDGGADIGCTNQANPFCLHLAGSGGLLIGEATFRLDAGRFQVLKIRADLFELAGPVDFGRARIVIDNTNNQIGAVTSDVYIARLAGPNSNYDAGRPVSLPSLVDLSDATIEVIGTTNFQIRLMTLGFGQATAGFPQPLKFEGLARISPKLINVPALVQAGALDGTIVGQPAVRIDYVRNQTSTGAGYDIEARLPGRPVRFYGDAGVMDDVSVARARVKLFDVAAGSVITARPGGVKSFETFRSGNPETLQIPGSNPPVGDEYYSLYTGQYVITSDTDITLNYGRITSKLSHNGTLMAARTVTLNTAGVRDGDEFHITRTGGGNFPLSIGGLVNLVKGTYCRVVFRAGVGWALREFGSLSTLQAVRVIKQSAVASAVTGTTAETVLATISVPAGAMGPNGSVRVTTAWSMTSSANSKTMRARFGGSTIQANTATTAGYYRMQCEIHNVNSETIQSSTAISASGFGAGGASPTATTQDTTQDVEITLVGTLSNAGETLTLESYLVEVMPSL